MPRPSIDGVGLRGLRIVVAVVALAVIGIGGAPLAATAATDPITFVRVDGSPFYPNADGVRDAVSLTVRLSRSVSLTVEVIDFDGAVVKTLLSGAPVTPARSRCAGWAATPFPYRADGPHASGDCSEPGSS
jgi:hypothetical protein